MSINSKTKYRIANKFDGVKPIKDQYDFEDKGNYGTGRISWSTPKKDKSGKTTFVNSTLKFICFGDTKDLIANNLDGKFNIEANLQNESFIGKDEKKVSFWQLTVFEANLAEEQPNQKAKANAYVDDEFDLESAPF